MILVGIMVAGLYNSSAVACAMFLVSCLIQKSIFERPDKRVKQSLYIQLGSLILLASVAVLKGIYFFKHQTCTANSEQELKKHHKVLQMFGFRALGSDKHAPV